MTQVMTKNMMNERNYSGLSQIVSEYWLERTCSGQPNAANGPVGSNRWGFQGESRIAPCVVTNELKKIWLLFIMASLALMLGAFVSCADDVDSDDSDDTDSTTSDSTCEEGDEDCEDDESDCEETDEDGNCADDEEEDDGDDDDDDDDEITVCDTADVTSSSIHTRYYSMIPGFNNDNCFLEYYTDRQFLACSAYEIPYAKIDGEYHTGPATLALTLGLDEDEDDLSTFFEEVAEDYDGPYQFLTDYEESGEHSIYVSGSDCSFTILGVDFLYGQLLDFYAYLDWYYYGSYYDSYSYGSGWYDPYY